MLILIVLNVIYAECWNEIHYAECHFIIHSFLCELKLIAWKEKKLERALIKFCSCINDQCFAEASRSTIDYKTFIKLKYKTDIEKVSHYPFIILKVVVP